MEQNSALRETQQERLYQGYINIINTRYELAEAPEREHITSELERCVARILNPKPEEHEIKIIEERRGLKNYQLAKSIRNEQGLSQEKVAKRFGVNQSTISNWEKGKVYPENQRYITWLQSHGYSED